MARAVLYILTILVVIAYGRSAVAPEGPEDLFFVPNEDESDQGGDKNLVKRSVGSAADERESLKNYPDLKTICTGFDNASSTVVYSYEYTSTLTDDAEVNRAIAQAGAYLFALQHRVMLRDDRYFDIRQFPDEHQLVFPPKLPAICYYTYKTLKGNSRRHITHIKEIFDREAKIKKYDTELEDNTNIHTFKTPELYKNYLQYRKNLLEGINILTNMHHQRQPDVERNLRSQCEKYINNQPFTISSNGADVLSWFAPKYHRARFNNVVKLFIGDLIMHEIFEQGCRAAGIKTLPKPFDWGQIRKVIVKADEHLNTTWFKQQLDEDVTSFFKDYKKDEKNNNNEKNNNDHGTYNPAINDYLSKKYYWLAFRTHHYTNTKLKKLKGACDSESLEVTTFKCIDEKGLLIAVRWKDLYGHSINVSHETSGASTELTNANRREVGKYFDDKARGEKVADTITKGLEAATAGLKKLTKQKEVFKMVNGQLIMETGKAILKIGQGLKTALKVITTVGKFLGPLATSVCAVLSMYHEEGPTAILEKLDEGFNKMHDRFDKLEEQLRSMLEQIKRDTDTKIAFWNAHSDYKKKVTDPLNDLRNDFKTVEATAYIPLDDGNNGRNASAFKIFNDLCIHDRTNPAKIISRMHDELTPRNRLSFGYKMLEWAKEDRFILQAYLLSYVSEIGELIALNTRCASYRYKKENAIMLESELSIAMEKTTEIQNAIALLDNDQLYGWQSTLRDELQLKNAALEKEYMKITTAQGIAQALEKKYNWNYFNVTTFHAYTLSDTEKDTFTEYSTQLLEDGKKHRHFMSHFIYNPDYSTVHFVQSGDSHVVYAIVNWQLMSESPSSKKFKYIPEIDRRAEGHTALCQPPFKEQVNLLAEAQDIKSMFIFHVLDGDTCHENPKHDMKSTESYYSTRTTQGWAHILNAGSANGTKEDHRTCWYATSKPWYSRKLPHRDLALVQYRIANYGNGY